MATDRNSLLAEAVCYVCATPGQWQLLKLGLLKQILLAQDPMADTSKEALLEATECYACATPGQWQLMELGLLSQIVAGGGVGGGTGGALSGTGDPVADPGTESALYYDRTAASLWAWDDTAGIWVNLGPI